MCLQRGGNYFLKAILYRWSIKGLNCIICIINPYLIVIRYYVLSWKILTTSYCLIFTSGIWTSHLFQLRISFLDWEWYRQLTGHSKWRSGLAQGLFIHSTTQTQKKCKISIYATSVIRAKYPRVREIKIGTPLRSHVHPHGPH